MQELALCNLKLVCRRELHRICTSLNVVLCEKCSSSSSKKKQTAKEDPFPVEKGEDRKKWSETTNFALKLVMKNMMDRA
jgi:hypothetical protein